jgi:hypothetical protein
VGDVPLEHDGGVEERGVRIRKGVDGGREKREEEEWEEVWWTLSLALSLARELGRTTPFRGGFADGPVMNRSSEHVGTDWTEQQ